MTHLEHVVAAVDVPVIASLNGTTTGGWTGVAKGMQEAGAAAIELNVYSVPSPTADSGHVIEQRHVEILRAVRESVSVPVAVKLSPYFSSTGEMAKSLVEAGADGLVLFNRFYQPDVDVETLTVSSSLTWSAPQEARLPRTWIAILRNQVTASLAGTTGVHHGHDVAAYLLAGADVVMTASALLEHGPAHAGTILEQLGSWMQRKGFANVKDVRGLLAVPPGIDVGMHERSGYVGVLSKAKATYGEI
ncbi:MAG: dihydroorotate dehydrogenase [Micrococcales bacterium]|nr:MAG: dihydroorotate dehydrogenase [Micrococcales bacterium]